MLRPPTTSLPRVEFISGSFDERRAATLDALLVMVPHDIAASRLARLPDGPRWRALHERSPVKAGSLRTTHLANPRQTLAVLGYLGADASPFQRLALAGRMCKELAARGALTVGLLALGDEARALEALLAAALAQSQEMPAFRSSPGPTRRVTRIVLPAAAPLDRARAIAGARGTHLARWLTALPPNKLDAPAYRALVAKLARGAGLRMRWFDEAALRRLGAGAFLAVAAGNAARTAGIAHLRYRPRKVARPQLALVGKGILFDTGGNNLKPHRGMLDMHTDMAGSAVALATILALAELRAPIAVDAWLAITENRIGPTAYRPQDIVTAANGTTIQVIHTDAEGRMVLADTLALAARARPRMILDFATLTGACVYALTERMSGVFTNRAALEALLLAAGRESGERVWGFPMDEDYDAELESKSADVLQCTLDGKGDHIYAARFLRRFVPEDIAWAHVDLASALRGGGLGHVTSDVTGFGVRFALELVLGQRALDVLGRAA